MTLTIADVAKVARLARIRLTETELPQMQNDLNGIMNWINQLNKINTDGVAPMVSVSGSQLPQRADIMNDGHYPHQIMQNAPEQIENFFVVPKVIE